MDHSQTVVQPLSNAPEVNLHKRSKYGELRSNPTGFSNQQQPSTSIDENSNNNNNNINNNNNQSVHNDDDDDDDDAPRQIQHHNNAANVEGDETTLSSSLTMKSSSSSSPVLSSSNVPVIARSVGAPLLVTWVTAHSTKKGTALLTGNFTIRTGIKLGDVTAEETVFEVKRSLLDLLQFRLGYLQQKPYLFIGDLPAEDAMKHDADEVLAFVHIVVNNPSLCDSVLTWHLLTTPQDELKAIGLPGTFSVVKNVLFGSGSIFGPTEIPKKEHLKVEIFSPQMVTNEELRNELFRVLDLVSDACELAHGFSYSRIRFNQRSVHWERLRVACLQLVATHSQLNEASSLFENSLREVACDGALFWPWTMQQTLADEKLRVENDVKRQEQQRHLLLQQQQQQQQRQQQSQRSFVVGGTTLSAQQSSDSPDNSSAHTTLGSPEADSATGSSPFTAYDSTDVYVTVSADPQKYTKTPHPSIRLGKSFLNAANLTENICKQTIALDLQNMITVVTLMTKVDLACAQSSSQAEDYFRHSSEELKVIVGLLKSIKELAASSSNFNEKELRGKLAEIGTAAEAVSKRVTEMQEDLRGQMQSVRMATHIHVSNEIERWVTGQRFTWTGAAVLASEVNKRIHAEVDGANYDSSGNNGAFPMACSSGTTSNNNNNKNKTSAALLNSDHVFLTESLPMFEVEAGKEKKEISFGPPVLEDVSLAFNLQSKPNAARGWFGGDKKRAARSAVSTGTEDGSAMSTLVVNPSPNRLQPQPRRERRAAATNAVRASMLDDPFARL